MEFSEISNLFENLENNNRRLNKIVFLRDFLEKNPETGFLIFDIISNNFQREINKKDLGISLKTIFSVFSFLSKKTEKEVESQFNKTGDIGNLASDILKDKKQKSLYNNKLNLTDIIKTLKEITNTKGNNSNTIKKERLSKLFLSTTSQIEDKFLARLLVNDLRIGVSTGVLKEAATNYFFPKILNLHFFCQKCNYFILNQQNCNLCLNKIDKNQEEILSKKYSIVEVNTPKNIVGLDEFIGRKEEIEEIKFLLRLNKKNHIIKATNPREIYNLFLKLFENKYNLINNFSKLYLELRKNLLLVLDCEIKLLTPIKSMLGIRVNSVQDSFKHTGKPSLIDFKYDGLRLQIHKSKDEIKLFSRNLEEITKQFPEVVDFIKLNFSIETFVIDCECVGYDYIKKEFLNFQVLSKRILTKNIKDVKSIKITIKAFDILYFNGKTLINESYGIRRKILNELFLERELKQKLYFNLKDLNKFKQNFNY